MPGESGAPRVLIVDDEQHVAMTFRVALEDEYDVDVATSGEAALQMVEDGYDVVLLDRRMPGVSGDDVLEEFHRRDVDSQFVLVTAVEPDVSILELRCTDYVVKPVESDQLREAVHRALRIGEYSDRRRELGSKKLKRNVLEVEHSKHELEDDETYRQLVADIERLESEVDAIEADLGIENVDRFL